MRDKDVKSCCMAKQVRAEETERDNIANPTHMNKKETCLIVLVAAEMTFENRHPLPTLRYRQSAN